MAGSEAGPSIDAVSVAIPSPRFIVPAGKLEDGLVWQAIGLVDRSELLATIELWES